MCSVHVCSAIQVFIVLWHCRYISSRRPSSLSEGIHKCLQTPADSLWKGLSLKIYIEPGPDMLIVVEKIFLQGISLDIVYTESMILNNQKNFTEFRKKYESLLNRDGGQKQYCVIIYTYISQIRPLKLRLLVII